LRPLLAGWNALFHQTTEFKPDPAKSEQWNRGAYLVEGLGHCSGCHSPRNTLGAEQRNAYLAGGFAEGWEAPPLTSISHAPIPWTEDELFAYLRTGHSRYHGVAAGPMAPVVRDLKALPDQDIRAMAVYLNSFNETATDRQAQDALAAKFESTTQVSAASSTGARLYLGACAVCHEVGGLPLFGTRPSLALNSNLHSATSDNLVQAILHGITEPVSSDLGYMPAFRNSMSDAQVEELVTFLRKQFAPGKPAWTGVRETIARVRSSVD
jgi:nicotinate dehydrogenase subunit B